MPTNIPWLAQMTAFHKGRNWAWTVFSKVVLIPRYSSLQLGMLWLMQTRLCWSP